MRELLRDLETFVALNQFFSSEQLSQAPGIQMLEQNPKWKNSLPLFPLVRLPQSTISLRSLYLQTKYYCQVNLTARNKDIPRILCQRSPSGAPRGNGGLFSEVPLTLCITAERKTSAPLFCTFFWHFDNILANRIAWITTSGGRDWGCFSGESIWRISIVTPKSLRTFNIFH